MIAIYKYKLAIQSEQVIKLPVLNTILSVRTQDGAPFLYANVDTLSEERDVTVRTYGTGQEIDPNLVLEYVGTYELCGGQLVYHVFID